MMSFTPTLQRPCITYIVKATDENLTSENWEVILNVCDKVLEEGEPGYFFLFLPTQPNALTSRSTALAMLSPPSSNASHIAVQTSNSTHFPSQSLSPKTVGSIFTASWLHAPSPRLSRSSSSIGWAVSGFDSRRYVLMIYSFKTTHDKVRKRALNLVGVWTAEFERDPSLGVMEECYSNLKAKSEISSLPFLSAAEFCQKIISFSRQTSLLRLPSTMRYDGGRRRSFNGSWRCPCMTRVVEPGTPSTRRSQAVRVGQAPLQELVPVPTTLKDPLIHQVTCPHRVRRVHKELQHHLLHRYHRSQSPGQHLRRPR